MNDLNDELDRSAELNYLFTILDDAENVDVSAWTGFLPNLYIQGTLVLYGTSEPRFQSNFYIVTIHPEFCDSSYEENNIWCLGPNIGGKVRFIQKFIPRRTVPLLISDRIRIVLDSRAVYTPEVE